MMNAVDRQRRGTATEEKRRSIIGKLKDQSKPKVRQYHEQRSEEFRLQKSGSMASSFDKFIDRQREHIKLMQGVRGGGDQQLYNFNLNQPY